MAVHHLTYRLIHILTEEQRTTPIYTVVAQSNEIWSGTRHRLSLKFQEKKTMAKDKGKKAPQPKAKKGVTPAPAPVAPPKKPAGGKKGK